MTLIDKQVAIDEINHICPVDTEYDCVLLDRVDVICVLSDLPSAEPERKKGKWVWKNKKVFCPSDCWWPPTEFQDTWDEKEGSWIEEELYCSECNYENWRHYRSNFCPNCGAKMEEDDEID